MPHPGSLRSCPLSPSPTTGTCTNSSFTMASGCISRLKNFFPRRLAQFGRSLGFFWRQNRTTCKSGFPRRYVFDHGYAYALWVCMRGCGCVYSCMCLRARRRWVCFHVCVYVRFRVRIHLDLCQHIALCLLFPIKTVSNANRSAV